ncbi:MAG: cytidylate kinase [Ferrovum sp. 37-45-19]|jgi:cytidylate kinase|nr:MAG: cytidylate kinase [Ferrovum sp. 21-44-67]OYV93824.1 MAG: cytidylate kinase [Ferrovum sp. 37-45-19]OZB32067.1 MAG: cytidylate kinase [Ferrovum sp. 34-44-207]HQT82140.1 (d)CMP kinase [Ferrovaceae bacterium]HQU07188.1 (d)CMP kinase [Ferrovaceae bacterium]
MIAVIAIDGPSASGKGTVAKAVAEQLGFHYLDSGALYRITAYCAKQRGISELEESRLNAMLQSLFIEFKHHEVYVDNHLVSEAIRSEECGQLASKVASLKLVREALLSLQRGFCRPPGLVADGRDMGSVVFPEAILKVYLTASPEVRAQRRYNQLINKGISANIINLLQDIIERDRRDQTRTESPLIQLADAHYLDTTALSIEESVSQVLHWFHDIIQ